MNCEIDQFSYSDLKPINYRGKMLLNTELKEINKILENMLINFEVRENTLKKLAGITLGNQNKSELFIKFFNHQLIPNLEKQLTDNRLTVIREVCRLFSLATRELGTSIEFCSLYMLSNNILFKCINNLSLPYINLISECILNIVRNVQTLNIINNIYVQRDSKNEYIRNIVVKCLIIITKKYHKSVILNSLDLIEDLLCDFLSDSNEENKLLAIISFLYLHKRFPNEAKDFFENLNEEIQSQIIQEEKDFDEKFISDSYSQNDMSTDINDNNYVQYINNDEDDNSLDDENIIEKNFYYKIQNKIQINNAKRSKKFTYQRKATPDIMKKKVLMSINNEININSNTNNNNNNNSINAQKFIYNYKYNDNSSNSNNKVNNLNYYNSCLMNKSPSYQFQKKNNGHSDSKMNQILPLTQDNNNNNVVYFNTGNNSNKNNNEAYQNITVLKKNSNNKNYINKYNKKNNINFITIFNNNIKTNNFNEIGLSNSYKTNNNIKIDNQNENNHERNSIDNSISDKNKTKDNTNNNFFDNENKEKDKENKNEEENNINNENNNINDNNNEGNCESVKQKLNYTDMYREYINEDEDQNKPNNDCNDNNDNENKNLNDSKDLVIVKSMSNNIKKANNNNNIANKTKKRINNGKTKKNLSAKKSKPKDKNNIDKLNYTNPNPNISNVKKYHTNKCNNKLKIPEDNKDKKSSVHSSSTKGSNKKNLVKRNNPSDKNLKENNQIVNTEDFKQSTFSNEKEDDIIDSIKDKLEKNENTKINIEITNIDNINDNKDLIKDNKSIINDDYKDDFTIRIKEKENIDEVLIDKDNINDNINENNNEKEMHKKENIKDENINNNSNHIQNENEIISDNINNFIEGNEKNINKNNNNNEFSPQKNNERTNDLIKELNIDLSSKEGSLTFREKEENKPNPIDGEKQEDHFQLTKLNNISNKDDQDQSKNIFNAPIEEKLLVLINQINDITNPNDKLLIFQYLFNDFNSILRNLNLLSQNTIKKYINVHKGNLSDNCISIQIQVIKNLMRMFFYLSEKFNNIDIEIIIKNVFMNISSDNKSLSKLSNELLEIIRKKINNEELFKVVYNIISEGECDCEICFEYMILLIPSCDKIFMNKYYFKQIFHLICSSNINCSQVGKIIDIILRKFPELFNEAFKDETLDNQSKIVYIMEKNNSLFYFEFKSKYESNINQRNEDNQNNNNFNNNQFDYSPQIISNNNNYNHQNENNDNKEIDDSNNNNNDLEENENKNNEEIENNEFPQEIKEALESNDIHKFLEYMKNNKNYIVQYIKLLNNNKYKVENIIVNLINFTYSLINIDGEEDIKNNIFDKELNENMDILLNECVHFLINNSSNYVIIDIIKNIFYQLPLKLSSQKYFSIISKYLITGFNNVLLQLLILSIKNFFIIKKNNNDNNNLEELMKYFIQGLFSLLNHQLIEIKKQVVSCCAEIYCAIGNNFKKYLHQLPLNQQNMIINAKQKRTG